MAAKEYLITILLFSIMISTTLSEFNPRQVEGTNIENEISITIEGTNLQILYKFFKENPSQVFIN